MIKTYDDTKNEALLRIRAKNIENQFLSMMESGIGIAPFVAKAILELVYDCFGLHENMNSSSQREGTIRLKAVEAAEPPGKRISECKTKDVLLTLISPEDQEIRIHWDEWKNNKKAGKATNITTALRRFRLLRVTAEAKEKGAYLTHEDLAFNIFGCGLKTIGRDIKALKQAGIILPTRGQQKDIGRGVSHKGQVIKWYLQGIEPKEIARRMYHSIKAVERYLKGFSKVVFLNQEGMKLSEMSFLTGLSYSLCAEYQNIYLKAQKEGKTGLIKQLEKNYERCGLVFLKEKGGSDGKKG